ncbi:MAG: hypothetical protein ACRDVC_06530 [Acidimicrobiales bacterium]
MKRFLSTLIVPTALLVGSLGTLGVVNAGPAAAADAHATMATKTWHGKVTKINETMGTTHSFSFKGTNMKIYTVHYDAMTEFTMGTRKDVKVGGLISVTGTLKSTTITATSIDL